MVFQYQKILLTNNYKFLPAVMWDWEKNPTQGNRRSCVSTKQFCTNTFGLQEWLRYLPMFPKKQNGGFKVWIL
jgi:hypothetical protein